MHARREGEGEVAVWDLSRILVIIILEYFFTETLYKFVLSIPAEMRGR